MTKAKLLALFFAGAASGAIAPRILSTGTSTQPARVLDWQNASLFNTRSKSRDGGATIAWRACGYLNEVQKDGGVRRLSEPCWAGVFVKGEFDSMVKAQLAAYDGGLLY